MIKSLFLFCILLAIILLSLTLIKRTPHLNNEHFDSKILNSNNIEISPSYKISKKNGPTNKKCFIQDGKDSYYKIQKNIDPDTDYKLTFGHLRATTTSQLALFWSCSPLPLHRPSVLRQPLKTLTRN